ncbi:hypothetical protein UlMin_022079 [Ulmus minor]
MEYKESQSYEEALSHLDSKEWKITMKAEMTSLAKNETWTLVEKPTKQKIVGCKWIYKLKKGTDEGGNKKYKACLVAKGYTQREGVDYNDVFSPVVKYKTIRLVLALIAQFDWDLEHMDVTTAFLHGELEEEIYICQPQGFEISKGG